MTFDEYQAQSRVTAVYPNLGKNFIYPTLGLVSEAGEVANKVKKVSRDNNDVLDEAMRDAIKKEIGDTLWYVAQLCTELGVTMESLARENLEKLLSRKERGVLHGNGDNR